MNSFGPPYPFSLPTNAKVALLPSVVFELWLDGQTPGKNLPGGFISANIALDTRDLRIEKMIEFGGRTGMWRLLEVLEQEQVRCSVLATGRACEVHSEIVQEYHRLGHEITAHSYTEDVSSYDFRDPEDERANIRRTADVIERVTGERPTGWISPRATPGEHTARLLVEEGFVWSGDYPDDELPYVMDVQGKRLVVLPYSGLAVNDYQVTLVEGSWPGVYVEEFQRTLEFLLEQYRLTGRPGVLRTSVHAHVYGRSWGRWAFRDAIRCARHAGSDVWIGTRDALAKHILEQDGG